MQSVVPQQTAADLVHDWFRGAGLGAFIHWGFVAQVGYEMSWAIVGHPELAPDGTRREITIDEYFATVDSFRPEQFDATAMVRTFKEMGATYVVFPARHHDGYTMYRSAAGLFGVTDAGFDRDVMGEFIDAARTEGLRIGVYYSLLDWHHPDYPAFRMADRPYPDERVKRVGPQVTEAKRRHRRPDPDQWQRYLTYVRDQLTEILTQYGPIDLLWFDGEWERAPQDWDAAGLREHIKSLAPQCIINNRLQQNGDYETPEQGMPMDPLEGPWELCMTMGDQWAYREDEVNIKSPRRLVGRLAEVVSLGGNLLLNFGPDAQGQLPEYQHEGAAKIADWMARHRDSVIGAEPAPHVQHYGPVTQSDTAIYLHLVHPPVDAFEVSGASGAGGAPHGRWRRT